MATDPLAGVSIETKGVPTIYCNLASPSLSFNDIRIYLAEVVPSTVAASHQTETTARQPSIETRACIVISPEFAKSFAQSVSQAVEKYEAIFGALRTPLTQEQFEAKVAAQNAQKGS